MGLVGSVTSAIDSINPIRIIGVAGIDLNSDLRSAALLALPFGFGLSLTKISVQTYINRRVPVGFQGRAFALQNALKHGLTIIPLATLGAAATTLGVEDGLDRLSAPVVGSRRGH